MEQTPISVNCIKRPIKGMYCSDHCIYKYSSTFNRSSDIHMSLHLEANGYNTTNVLMTKWPTDHVQLTWLTTWRGCRSVLLLVGVLWCQPSQCQWVTAVCLWNRLDRYIRFFIEMIYHNYNNHIASSVHRIEGRIDEKLQVLQVRVSVCACIQTCVNEEVKRYIIMHYNVKMFVRIYIQFIRDVVSTLSLFTPTSQT